MPGKLNQPQVRTRWSDVLLGLSHSTSPNLRSFLDDHQEQLTQSQLHKASKHWDVNLTELNDVQKENAKRVAKLANVSIEELIATAPLALDEDDLHILQTFYQEKRYIIRVTCELFRISTEPSHINCETGKHSVVRLCANEQFLPNCFQYVSNLCDGEPPASARINEAVLKAWSEHSCLAQLYLLQLIFIASYDKIPASASSIQTWFQLMKSTQFLYNQSTVSVYHQSDILEMIQSVACIVCIEMLTLEFDESDINPNLYLHSKSCLIELHSIILSFSDLHLSAPIILAWSIILHRYPDSSIEIADLVDQQTCSQLAQHALSNSAFSVLSRVVNISLKDGNVLGYKIVLSELLRQSLDYVRFSEAIADAFSVLHGHEAELSLRFWNDEQSRKTLDVARVRFPYQFEEFSKMIESVSKEIQSTYEYLSLIPTFTEAMPIGFKGYDVIPEDGASTLIVLTDDVVIFPNRRDGSGAVLLTKGTKGRIMSEGKSPSVVMWEYKYNAWSYLGRLLESLSNDLHLQDYRHKSTMILHLLSIVIPFAGVEVLNSASDDLAAESDVISIVTSILEYHVSGGEVDTALICAGIDFLEACLQIAPSRIWPAFGKTGLLAWNGRNGHLARILSSNECAIGRFPVSIRTLKLFRNLILDAIASSVHPNGVRQLMRSQILLSICQHCTEIWESYHFWSYQDICEKVEIGHLLFTSFELLFLKFFEVDEESLPGNKINCVLWPAVHHLTTFLLGSNNSVSGRAFGAFHRCLDAKEMLQSPSLELQHSQIIRWIQSSLKFCTTLLRSTNLLKDQSVNMVTAFEAQIYEHSSSLSRLFSQSPKLQIDTLNLLGTLMTVRTLKHGYSLLSHLGTTQAKDFVRAIDFALRSPFPQTDLQIALWVFCSSVIEGRQRGLALLLLTGDCLPDQENVRSSETIFTVALDAAVSTKDSTVDEVTISVLEFISCAQNYWVAGVGKCQQRDELFNYLFRLLNIAEIANVLKSSQDVIGYCLKMKAASLAARILAIQLQNVGQRNSDRGMMIARKVQTLATPILQKSLFVDGYRASLHGNLHRNFERRWPSLTLSKFAKSSINKLQYGASYFYDLSMCEVALCGDKAWPGTKIEIEEANINLSIVNAQVVSLDGYTTMYNTLVRYSPLVDGLDQKAHEIASIGLVANIKEVTYPTLSARICTTRAVLVFNLLQSIKNRRRDDHFGSILVLCWNSLFTGDPNYTEQIASNDRFYCQVMLRMAYFCFQRLDDIKLSQLPAKTFHPAISGLFDTMVIKTFSKLINMAKSGKLVSGEMDLVIALLQQILAINEVDIIMSQFVSIVNQSDCMRACLSLFSWSAKLIVEEEPLYGELALLFLLEISIIPDLAEQMAIHGIIDSFLESKVSEELQQGGVTSMDNPCLHRIWAKGMLPLVINLFMHLDTRFANQTKTFLKIFWPQIQFALDSWAQPKVVTLASVQETAVIITLMTAMEQHSNVNLEGLTYDKDALVENINYVTLHQKYLASLIIPITNDDKKLQSEKVEASNQLNQTIVEKLREIVNIVVDPFGEADN